MELDKNGTSNSRSKAKRQSKFTSDSSSVGALQRRLKGIVAGHAHCSGRKPVFSKEQEEEREVLIVDVARRGFPLTDGDIRDLAHQFASKNHTVGLSSKNDKAGYYWMKMFLQRHR